MNSPNGVAHKNLCIFYATDTPRIYPINFPIAEGCVNLNHTGNKMESYDLYICCRFPMLKIQRFSRKCRSAGEIYQDVDSDRVFIAIRGNECMRKMCGSYYTRTRLGWVMFR